MVYIIGIILTMAMASLNFHVYVTGGQDMVSMIVGFFCIACTIAISLMWVKS